MAIKISQLTPLPAATTTTLFPVIQTGVNYRASFGNIVTFVSNNLTSLSGNLAVAGSISATNITGTLATAAQPNVTSVGTLTSLSVTGSLTAGSISATGTTTVKGINEAFTIRTGTTGVVAHDYSAGTIFSHSSIAADFTVNLTNLTLPTLNTTNITLVLTQGETAYIPSALQIAGAAQSIKWQGGSAPTGNANKTDLVSFSILNNAGNYTVLGQLVTFG